MALNIEDRITMLELEWTNDYDVLQKLDPQSPEYKTVRENLKGIQDQIESLEKIRQEEIDRDRKFKLEEAKRIDDLDFKTEQLELDRKHKKWQVGLGIATLGTTLTQTFGILNYEKVDMIRSKAIGFINKLDVRKYL